MELNDTQRKQLKTVAHQLKPIVMIGQHGMKDTTRDEIINALEFHQLIKIKVAVGDRDARDELINEIIEFSKADLIQKIGNIAVLFKNNPRKYNVFQKPEDQKKSPWAKKKK